MTQKQYHARALWVFIALFLIIAVYIWWPFIGSLVVIFGLLYAFAYVMVRLYYV